MVNKYYQKHKKSFKKKYAKDMKIFLKNKTKKRQKGPKADIKIFLKKKKKRKLSISEIII